MLTYGSGSNAGRFQIWGTPFLLANTGLAFGSETDFLLGAVCPQTPEDI